MKKTSFKITRNIKYIEEQILKRTGLSLAAFHRKAIDDFINEKGYVEDRFKIRKTTHPDYVAKDFLENIYIDEEREQLLLKIAEREQCGITIILFQAVYDLCVKWGNLLDEDIFNILFNK